MPVDGEARPEGRGRGRGGRGGRGPRGDREHGRGGRLDRHSATGKTYDPPIYTILTIANLFAATLTRKSTNLGAETTVTLSSKSK